MGRLPDQAVVDGEIVALDAQGSGTGVAPSDARPPGAVGRPSPRAECAPRGHSGAAAGRRVPRLEVGSAPPRHLFRAVLRCKCGRSVV